MAVQELLEQSPQLETQAQTAAPGRDGQTKAGRGGTPPTKERGGVNLDLHQPLWVRQEEDRCRVSCSSVASVSTTNIQHLQTSVS